MGDEQDWSKLDLIQPASQVPESFTQGNSFKKEPPVYPLISHIFFVLRLEYLISTILKIPQPSMPQALDGQSSSQASVHAPEWNHSSESMIASYPMQFPMPESDPQMPQNLDGQLTCL
jgi:hypothetical protein